MRFCVYIETIVKSFERYHKYTIGVDMRIYSKDILFLIHRANSKEDKRVDLEKLRDKCEDMKLLLYLANELKAYRNQNNFEYATKLSVDICRQSQSWLNSCQN